VSLGSRPFGKCCVTSRGLPFTGRGKPSSVSPARGVGGEQSSPLWRKLAQQGILNKVKVRTRLELGSRAACPCIGVLCFVVAFIASVVATEASADSPLTAIKGTPLVVPAAVLGVSNPYLIRAALPTPKAQRFLLSQDIRDLAKRVDDLARYGLDLNQRTPQPQKLQLRVQSRELGALLQICYRH